MATEKILIFDEAGNAKRMKVRIARFLDNEPVTASDKENIRTTLDVDDSLSGTFTTPLSVTSASDSSFTGGGNVSVGGSTFAAGKLRVEDSNGNHVWLKGRSSDGNSSVSFRNNADSAYNGRIAVDDSTGMNFQVAGSTRCTIDSSGNLNLATGNLEFATGADITMPDNTGAALEIKEGANPYLRFITTNGGEKIEVYKETHHSANIVMGSNLGIDFGSVAGGTGTPAANGGLLDDYETGIFSPSFSTTGTGFTTVDIIYSNAVYTKIGNCVTFSIFVKTREIDATGATGNLCISNLPFAARSDSGNYSGAVNVGYAHLWTNAPEGGYIGPGASRIQLTKRVTSITGSLSECVPTDMTTGVNTNHNQIMVSGHYYTA